MTHYSNKSSRSVKPSSSPHARITNSHPSPWCDYYLAWLFTFPKWLLSNNQIRAPLMLVNPHFMDKVTILPSKHWCGKHSLLVYVDQVGLSRPPNDSRNPSIHVHKEYGYPLPFWGYLCLLRLSNGNRRWLGPYHMNLMQLVWYKWYLCLQSTIFFWWKKEAHGLITTNYPMGLVVRPFLTSSVDRGCLCSTLSLSPRHYPLCISASAESAQFHSWRFWHFSISRDSNIW